MAESKVDSSTLCSCGFWKNVGRAIIVGLILVCSYYTMAHKKDVKVG